MKRKSIASRMFAAANLFKHIARIGAKYQGNQHRAELDRLKAENLILKNRNDALKNGQEHNKVLKGDLEIELLNLRIEEKKWSNQNKGIGVANVEFNPYYDDPGDVRNGIVPPK